MGVDVDVGGGPVKPAYGAGAWELPDDKVEVARELQSRGERGVLWARVDAS